jgi:hypothetical protein
MRKLSKIEPRAPAGGGGEGGGQTQCWRVLRARGGAVPPTCQPLPGQAGSGTITTQASRCMRATSCRLPALSDLSERTSSPPCSTCPISHHLDRPNPLPPCTPHPPAASGCVRGAPCRSTPPTSTLNRTFCPHIRPPATSPLLSSPCYLVPLQCATAPSMQVHSRSMASVRRGSQPPPPHSIESEAPPPSRCHVHRSWIPRHRWSKNAQRC